MVNSSSTLDCTELNEQNSKGYLGPNFTCTALHPVLTATSRSTTATLVPTSTNSNQTSKNASAPLSSKAIAGIAIGSILGFSILATGFWLVYRRQKAKKVAEVRRSELAANVPVELPTDKGDVELEAKHGGAWTG